MKQYDTFDNYNDSLSINKEYTNKIEEYKNYKKLIN
jgi:hypothetical protein